MNTRILVPAGLLAALAFTGCAKKDVPLTDAQKATIRQEVIQTMQAMIAAEERLDANCVWAFHADVPGYLWADFDGRLYDYSGTRKSWAEYYADCTRLKFTTRRQEVMVLGPDAAYYLWHGSAEVTQKSGVSSKVAPWTARYLWRRIDGAWKIVGGQESYEPPQAGAPSEPKGT